MRLGGGSGICGGPAALGATTAITPDCVAQGEAVGLPGADTGSATSGVNGPESLGDLDPREGVRVASQTHAQVIVPIVLELARDSRNERPVCELGPVLVVQPLELSSRV